MVGASHDALWAERRRDPAFDAKVREAMVKQKLSWIKNAGEKKPDWMLSMRCPGEYGRKDRYSLEQFAAFVDRVCDKILPEIPEERREIVRSKIEAELTHEAIKGGVIPDDSNGT